MPNPVDNCCPKIIGQRKDCISEKGKKTEEAETEKKELHNRDKTGEKKSQTLRARERKQTQRSIVWTLEEKAHLSDLMSKPHSEHEYNDVL